MTSEELSHQVMTSLTIAVGDWWCNRHYLLLHLISWMNTGFHFTGDEGYELCYPCTVANPSMETLESDIFFQKKNAELKFFWSSRKAPSHETFAL